MAKLIKNYTIFTFFIIIVFFSVPVFAQSIASGMPALNIVDQGNGETTYSLSLQILALMTALTVLPSLILGMTSFTRIIIVLSILRQAMGTQQTPPNQVLIAIALFLSFFIMSPTLTKIYDESITPFMAEELSAEAAISSGSTQIKEFMVKNTRKNDLSMFSDMSGTGNYQSAGDVPFSVILPAFITSELKTAFQIGFVIYIPFLVIDMVVSAVLMAMGMMMLPPIMISLPFKLMLFVLVDGWHLLVGSMVKSFVPI